MKNAYQITDLQREMIVAIAEDEDTPLHGKRPSKVEDTVTWSSNIVNTNQLKGVLVSMQSDDLVFVSVIECDPSANVIALTQHGLKVYNQIKDEIIPKLVDEFNILVEHYKPVKDSSKFLTPEIMNMYITLYSKAEELKKLGYNILTNQD